MPKTKTQPYAKIPNNYVSIERSRGLSLLEEKLVYMTINAMQKRYNKTCKLGELDYDFITKDIITFDDFCEQMQIGIKDYKLLYTSLKNLFDFSLAVRHDQKTRFIHLFQDMIIDENTKEIHYQFGNTFVQYFTGICREYFELETQEVISLHSSYAIRIYQMLKAKLNLPEKEFIYVIEDLKNQLNLKTKYNVYNNFKQYVLEIAKLQINNSEVCKFSFDYEEIKTGRKVTAIKFIIIPKQQNYYIKNNKIAPFQIKHLRAKIKFWASHENNTVRILAGKIQEELRFKQPSRAAIGAYIDTINLISGENTPKL